MRNFKFGNNEIDFRKWCTTYISKAKTTVERYENNSEWFNYTPVDEYRDALKILHQYTVLKHALNLEQRDILDYCLIEGEEYPFGSRRKKSLIKYIFSIWQEICFNPKRPTLKKIDNFYLGHYLRLMRVNRNLSVARVSRILGINAKTLYDYESGSRSVSLNTLYGISQIYDVGIDDILASYQTSKTL